MTLFPNAKINIGLHITGKRDDGFHSIETIFYPIPLMDALEFVESDRGSDSDELTVTGFAASVRMQDNLVIKALEKIRERYNIPALRIHLHKAIPPGSGMGGGSSDAAYMIRYLNRYFRLGLCNKDMSAIALELGSDIPFFIYNYPCIAEGRGELLTKTDNLLKGINVAVINPGIHISTAEAYSSIVPRKPGNSLSSLYNLPVMNWKDVITNDFEEWVFSVHPVVGEIKSRLLKSGALYSSMTGSGSSVYGLFNEKPDLSSLEKNYWCWQGVLE